MSLALQRAVGIVQRGASRRGASLHWACTSWGPREPTPSPNPQQRQPEPTARAPAAARCRRRCLLPARLAASYTVVTGDSGDNGGPATPWKLVIYSKEGCHLCEGLKEKVEVLLERAAFLPSALSAAELEVRDITSQPDWEAKYAMSIPVLAAAAADGSSEVELPRPSPRFTADALQRHIEKHLAALQAGA